MELSHSFTVPLGVDETWAHFQDIAALAECFPGAVVTGVEGDTFTGTVKVKLGPIALQYAGSGTFTEKDDAAHRFVVEAKGKDKRGNGTAGATVTLQMTDAGGATAIDVQTDLAGDVVLGNLEGTLSTGGSSKCGGKSTECFAFQTPPSYARWLARAYPVRTAGTLLSLTSNPSAGTAELTATSPAVRSGDKARATLVRLPVPFNASRLTVTGARIEVEKSAGGREVWLYPTGGPYRLSAAR